MRPGAARLLTAEDEMRIATVVSVLVLAVALGVALPSRSQEAARPSYAADIEPIFVKRCLGCHDAERAKAGLVLEEGTGYERLVNVPSLQAPDLLRVRPGDPEASYLWLKLTHRPREGKGMPRTLFGSKKLPRRELELVRAWIRAGAQP